MLFQVSNNRWLLDRKLIFSESLILIDAAKATSLLKNRTGLQTIENWEEWFVHHMVALPFRRTLSGWRNGLTELLWSFINEKPKSCTKCEITPCITTGWGRSLQRRWSWWTSSCTWGSNVPLQQRRSAASWCPLGRALTEGRNTSVGSVPLWMDFHACL